VFAGLILIDTNDFELALVKSPFGRRMFPRELFILSANPADSKYILTHIQLLRISLKVN
jgi:hypothetical protein